MPRLKFTRSIVRSTGVPVCLTLRRKSSTVQETQIPYRENFILDSLYQIKQVRKFKVELDGREKGLAMPEVRSNAPFALICECAEEREARLEKSRQEERERQWIKQQEEQIRRQEEAEKHRLLMVQRETDRLRSEQERKADEIAQSYQSVPGW